MSKDTSLVPSPPRRRWWPRLAGLVVALALAGAAAVVHLLASVPRAIVSAPNTNRIVDPRDDPRLEELARLGVNRQLRVEVGPPAASLSVWIIEPTRQAALPERGTILVLHGVQDRKSSMLGVGKALAAAGYRAVLVDLRGHGRSSGRWLTYGVVESRDLSQVIDALARQGLADDPIAAYGVSYGGAMAIMLAAADERVRAIVAVAPFSSMQEEVGCYIRQQPMGRLLSDQRIEQDIAAAGRLADFNPVDASPLQAISRTKACVLLIHGREDRKIPYQQSAALHAAAPDHSDLVVVDGEDHDSISCDRTGTVIRRGVAWFRRWLGKE